MIRAICWKEFREQWVVALAILTFAALAMTLMAQFTDAAAGGGWTQMGAREVMPAGLAYLAGAVCGAILLADEKEVGTLEFLDTLPGRRRDLWLGKAVFGVAATTAQAGVLGGLAYALGVADPRLAGWQYVVALALVGLVAFGWGMFGGALARSVLGAVFLGSLWVGPAALALTIPFVLVFQGRAFVRPYGAAQGVLYALLLMGIGLGAARLWFTRPDRDRGTPRFAAAGRRAPAAGRKRLAGPRALVWLSARQSVWITIGAAAAAVAAGAALLAPDAQPLFAWPELTLAFGVLAGVTVLGEEQVRGAAQFWAERRLPLGRLWLVKVGFHFALAAGAALVLLVVLAAGSWGDPFRTQLLTQLAPELGRFLWLGLVYGFVIGHLTGMAFRKTVVAGLVAVVTAATFAGLLLPSVIGGGAQAWQVWGPAVVLLLTARALLYPWATGRVFTRGPMLRAVGGTALAGLLLAAGIGYRVAEIPDAPDRLAEAGFEARIPMYDDDDGRRIARAALSQFRAAADEARPLLPTATTARPGGPPSAPGAPPLDQAAEAGWPDDPQTFRKWLDKVFANDWVRGIVAPGEPREDDPGADRVGRPIDPAERFDLPPWKLGVLEDPRNQSHFSTQVEEDGRTVREMAVAIRARGLQRLRDGDPVAMLRLVRGGLAVVRTARHMGGLTAVYSAFAAEATLLAGVHVWAGHLAGRPDLSRRMLAVLGVHEREMPAGAADAVWAEHLILRTTLEQVETWGAQVLARRGRGPADDAEPADAEAKLIGFAWSVPWERVRRERVLRVYTDPGAKPPPGWLSRLHRLNGRRADRIPAIEARDQVGRAQRRMARVVVALRLYRAETGRTASSLTDLVPAYLPEVPADPFSGGPIQYRVSNGEVLGATDRASLRHYPGVWDALSTAVGLAVSDGVPWVSLGSPLRENRRPPADAGIGGFAIPAPAGIQRESPPRVPVPVRPGDGLLWVSGPDPSGGRRVPVPESASQVDNDWLWVVPAARK